MNGIQTSPQERIRQDSSLLLIDNTNKFDGRVIHKRFLRGNGKEVVNQLESSTALDHVTIQLFRINPKQLYADMEREEAMLAQADIARAAKSGFDLISAAVRQSLMAAGISEDQIEKICNNTVVILQDQYPDKVAALLPKVD